MAYAALVSLEQLLNQALLRPHLHSDMREQSQSLLPKIEYLLKFLEDSSHKADEKTSSLITRIRDTSYRAQYLVDLYCYDTEMAIIQQLPKPKNMDLGNIFREIDVIESDIRELTGSATEEDSRLFKNDLQFRAGSPRRASEDVMVGFEDLYMELMDDLTFIQSKLEFVSVVGMGGIGKTTLAQHIYNASLVQYHFEIRAWVVASQSFRNMLLSLLDSMNMLSYEMHGQDENELKKRLFLTLKQRRYLVVIDDIWDTTVWDEIRKVLPNNEYGSRVLLTTRLADVAAYVSSSGHIHHVSLLSSEESRNLLCAKVVGYENYPPELQQIGQKILERCGGLPLSLVVMGGLLSWIDKTKEEWLNLEKYLTKAFFNPCLEILKMSYDYLPEWLKPCFLYMAHFQEDEEIPVSKLIKLWVAEGFLKQVQQQDPEAIAETCLKKLIDHSLIMVSKRYSEGNIKTCTMHSLLHDLCVIEASKEKFLIVRTPMYVHEYQETPHDKDLRISIHSKTPDLFSDSIPSFSFVRSLLYTGSDKFFSRVFLKFKLLRVLDAIKVAFSNFPSELFELLNLRYISFTCLGHIPALISKFQNLQTLVLHQEKSANLPEEIWDMSHLRHIELEEGSLPDPISTRLGSDGPLVLKYLHTLSGIKNLRFTDELLARIPRIERLKVSYDEVDVQKGWSYYEFRNLFYLKHLRTLKIYVHHDLVITLARSKLEFQFPVSLQELTLGGCSISWKDLSVVGSLPELEVLKLKYGSCLGDHWIPNEGEFPRLKLLLLQSLNLVSWELDHEDLFPCLEQLIVRDCYMLEEIPNQIGESPTLRKIELDEVNESVLASAEKIFEWQLGLRNDDFQVIIHTAKKCSSKNLIQPKGHSEIKESDAEHFEDFDSIFESVEETKQQKTPRLVSKGGPLVAESSSFAFREDISQIKNWLTESTRYLEGMEDPPRSYGKGVFVEEGRKRKINHDEENKISMDMLLNNIYTKDCIGYCSLLPTAFEFTKDNLASLWIAQGWTILGNDALIEEACIRCFDILLKIKYIVPTGYDPYGDQIKYKIGDEMHAFLQNHLIGPRFSKELDSNHIDEYKLEHLSLSFKEIGQINFEIIKKLNRLQTLIIHGCYGFNMRPLPFDLFLELKELRILSLSHTDVMELPSSIKSSKELRYLDMSETPIRWLPESMCHLSNLHTLKLESCLGLIELPECTKEWINLRHLILDVARQLQFLPEGIGNLSELRTLRAFLVGEDDGCRINELKHMNKLSGSIRILKLENIKSPAQAADASLYSKLYLKKIELQWSDFQDEKNPVEEEILTCLEPPMGIQELKILYYSGGKLPSWIGKRSFSEMVSIALHKCRYCSNLPSLGLLPSLKFLNIFGMDEVLEINNLFCGEQGNQNQLSFPALEKLAFHSMSKLEKWTEIRMGDFPRLVNLIIVSCPKLNGLPGLSPLKSLKHMEISYCPELSCLPDGILPSTLEFLMIKDCPKLKGQCSSEEGEDWPKIARVPVFYIDNVKIRTA